MSNELVNNVDIKVSSLAHELTASEMEVAVHACRGHGNSGISYTCLGDVLKVVFITITLTFFFKK